MLTKNYKKKICVSISETAIMILKKRATKLGMSLSGYLEYVARSLVNNE